MSAETFKLRRRVAYRYLWPWLVGYAYGKMRSDPAYRAVHAYIGDCSLPLLDIGCGMGVLAFYLRERGFASPITGLDVDEAKLDRARRIARSNYPDMDFQLSDCAELPPFSGNVSMLDVLHYFAPGQQTRILQEMAQRVAPNGWCIIRVTPQGEGWRFRCSLAVEQIAKRSSWITRNAIAFPTLEDIAAQFPEEQFSREIRPLWGWTPFNSWLLAFRKR